MLHLQCATGESTAELAELGALVTGVDISAEALDVARERWPDIAWVQADVHDLPSELKRGRFDLVYTAEGVLAWLLDLDAWAAGIAAALRSGGDFLLHEEHPVSRSASTRRCAGARTTSTRSCTSTAAGRTSSSPGRPRRRRRSSASGGSARS